MKDSNNAVGWRTLCTSVLNLFYPKLHCPCCREYHSGLCPRCKASFRKDAHGPDAKGVRSLYLYEGGAAKLLEAYKRGGSFFALDEWVQLFQEVIPKDSFHGVAYAPSSRHSVRALGFDHGKELGRRVARNLDAKLLNLFIPPLQVQKRLEREDRAKNAATIKLRHRWKETDWLKDKHVLLLDDVVTTGHTMHRLIDLLEERGVKVQAVTLARVERIEAPKIYP